MIEPRKTTPDDADETLVTPRFDAEETVQAQPVVPLDAAAAEALPPAPHHAPVRNATRHQWPLALVLVSALVGSVVGGTGLYLYQRQKSAPPAASEQTAAPQQTDAPEQVPQPQTPAPSEQASEPKADNATAEQLPAPEPAREAAAAEPDDDASEREKAEDRRAAPAPRAAAADDDRDDDERRAAAPRRGKKGDRDAELDARPRRASRDDDDDDDVAEADSRQARRIDSIIYRPRRAERRRAATRDRVRAIFEGQPE